MQKNPYYIVAPFFTSQSAGVRLLYILCEILNKKNHHSYIVLRDHHQSNFHGYFAPTLSHYEAQMHINSGLNPIIVNTDTGYDILNLPCKIRYLMNYIGIFLGEPKETDPEFQIDKKFFWAFSKDIAKRHNIPENRVMFTPIVDTEIFYPPKQENRKGRACYLGKYAEIFSQELPKEVDQNFYVFYRNPTLGNAPQRQEYAEKLRSCEMLYVYENTSVITEALMCGCVVVCVPNEYCQFTEKDMIGMQEVGLNGIAIGTSDSEIKRAKATVHLARERILQLMGEFDTKIDYFIEETQKISHSMKVDSNKMLQSIHAYFANQSVQRTLTFGQKLPREIKRILRNINIVSYNRDAVIIKIPYFLKSVRRRLRKFSNIYGKK